MAEERDFRGKPQDAGTASNVSPQGQGINPSAPSTGTAGWGTTSDEKDVISADNAAATRAGQMKGNLGDNMTEASNRASAAATTNKRPEPSTDTQPGASATLETSPSTDTTHGDGERSFRCADVGNADCRWETSGLTEEEVLEHAEEHGRTHHGWTDWTDAIRDQVRNAIQHRKAA